MNALYQRPEFKALSQDEKSALLQSLAGNPPVTPEKISKMFDLINSATSLSPANHKLVMEAFKDLPAPQQEAIELAFYGGLTHAEIAAKLDKPIGTVKTRIKLGMNKLRYALRPCWEAK